MYCKANKSNEYDILGLGTALTFGIFMNGLMETFGTNLSTTSTISSIQTGIICCICPIVSYLIKKFGCRQTTFVGLLVAAFGLFTSGVAQSIGMLYLTAGVCTG